MEVMHGALNVVYGCMMKCHVIYHMQAFNIFSLILGVGFYLVVSLPALEYTLTRYFLFAEDVSYAEASL